MPSTNNARDSTTADLAQELAGNFVVANLGAGGDRDYDFPAHLRRSMTLIEIDAGPQSKSSATYYAKYSTSSVVAGSSGKGKFRRNKYPYCSSLLPPREDLIRSYGVEEFYEMVEMTDVDCVTLVELLKGWGLSSVDFLKTDLEGLDFQVIQSLLEVLDSVLAIQCELRFQPFYIGEPLFHEAAGYLYDRGFELIGMRPDYWKPKTPHRKGHTDGRVVWSDCVFIRTPESVSRLFGEQLCLAHGKHILLSALTGQRSHAEFLLETYRQSLPAPWISELEPLTRPLPLLPRNNFAWRFAKGLYQRLAIMKSGLDFGHILKNRI